MDGMSDDIKVTVKYGHVVIVPAYKWDGDQLLMGGYSCHYDRDGRLEKVTPPEFYGSLRFE